MIAHRFFRRGTHDNLGYDALLWENILHGDCGLGQCGEYGLYHGLSVLLTKFRATYLNSTQIHMTASFCLQFPRTEAKTTSTS